MFAHVADKYNSSICPRDRVAITNRLLCSRMSPDLSSPAPTPLWTCAYHDTWLDVQKSWQYVRPWIVVTFVLDNIDLYGVWTHIFPPNTSTLCFALKGVWHRLNKHYKVWYTACMIGWLSVATCTHFFPRWIHMICQCLLVICTNFNRAWKNYSVFNFN
jgi:hypothetical protein